MGTDLIWGKSPNDIRDGIGYTRAAIALRPQSAHPVMILGVGYNDLGQYDQAIACYRKAIELAPNYAMSYTNLGNALSEKGLHEEAIAAYEQAIQLSSRNPPLTASVYGYLAMLLSTCPEVRLRNPRRAAELSDKAVEIAPEYGNHWTALGVVRYRDGRWDDARKALEKSLQLGTGGFGGDHSWDDAIDWFFLAMCHWQMKQEKEARRCYDRAVQEMKEKTWQTEDWDLLRFQKEAEKLLKITDEKPATESPVEVK